MVTSATSAAAREAGGAAADDLDWFRDRVTRLGDNISRVVVASEATVRFMLLGLLADGHILLQDTPGVGKTLLAKTLAQSMDGIFTRIQCTPDLLPSDITGTSVFNMQDGSFEFHRGPVFTNVLIADEINRTGPRTQSALLEAMAEGQVSADGTIYPLPRPFMVIATQNPVESYGVFPLPDSQLDRFLLSMSLDLPSETQEVEILSRVEHGLAATSPVVTATEVATMQEMVRNVEVALPVKQYLVNIARATRGHPQVAQGISPRGTVLLQRASQCWAALEGRSFMTPDDAKEVAPLVLRHRVDPRAGSGESAETIVREILQAVPVPV